MPLTDRLPVSSYPAFDVGRNAIQAAEIISADETKNKTRNETLENNTLISTYAKSSEVTGAKPSLNFGTNPLMQQHSLNITSNFNSIGSGITLDIYA